MTKKKCPENRLRALIAVTALLLGTASTRAEIDGHGPDAWRVTGVAANDVLNARMGPGSNYPVIETFAHNEREMLQVTCVPFYTAAHFTAMTDTQIKALPPRWCLMRNQTMSKTGWVAQRYITPEDEMIGSVASTTSRSSPDPYATNPDVDPVGQAQDLVREIYEQQFLWESGSLVGPLDPAVAGKYFTDEIVAWLGSDAVDSHPLYDAQDFDGTIGEPIPDPDYFMMRGMVTINVDFTNFGRPKRAVFYVQPDMTKQGSPMRVFLVEHDGWSYP